MQLKTVVLPAPLGPMIEWIAPCSHLELEAVDGDQAAEALGHLLGPEQRGAGHDALLGNLGPLHRHGLGVDLELAALGCRRPQALGLEPHDGDDRQAVEQIAELAELAQHLRQADQDERRRPPRPAGCPGRRR